MVGGGKKTNNSQEPSRDVTRAMERIADAMELISKSTENTCTEQRTLAKIFAEHEDKTDRIALAHITLSDKTSATLAASNERTATSLAIANERAASTLAAVSEKTYQTQVQSNEKLSQILAAQSSELKSIREDFKTTVYPIMKWLAVAIIVIAGGAEAVRLLGV